MGVKIDGDRLGLGTNLFSNKKTITEEYGFDYVDGEISKKSSFYNTNINFSFLCVHHPFFPLFRMIEPVADAPYA